MGTPTGSASGRLVASVIGAAMVGDDDAVGMEDSTQTSWMGARLSRLHALKMVKLYAREASMFHVASTRFWEATLLPVAVVVVVAFSSCMDRWIGQFVSLSCWYASNYYTMGYTLQILHPQVTSRPLLQISPFDGPCPLAFWSMGLALFETVFSALGRASVAQAVGTTLYGLSGSIWLHLFISPWRCIPAGWRPHQVFRWWVEDRPLESKRCPGSGHATDLTEAPEDVARRRIASDQHKPANKQEPGGSIAGHAALAVAGYALLATWQVAAVSPVQPAAVRRGPEPSWKKLRRPPTVSTKTNELRPSKATLRYQPQKQPRYTTVSASKANAPLHPLGTQYRSEQLTVKTVVQSSEENQSQLQTSSKFVAMDFQENGEKPDRNSSARLLQILQENRSASSLQVLQQAFRRLDASSAFRSARASRTREAARMPREAAAPGLRLLEGQPAKARLPPSASNGRGWDGMVIMGALVVILLMLLESGKSSEFSIPYLLCYNMICLRIPDVLGQWVVKAVADMQMSPATTTTAISFAYMISMQAYLVLLKWVSQNMSAPNLFPRFHFVAQMYYYLFWYMMLMVLSPGGVEDRNFWMLVCFLNGTSMASNAGLLNNAYALFRPRAAAPDPPLKVLFDSKLAVQDQLADVVSLLVVPGIATAFHICTSLSVPDYPSGPLISLWTRFGVLLIARLLSGLLTEEIFRRRVDLLNKADAMELQLLPIDESQNRTRYLNDIGPKLALESMRNIERCEVYFAAVAIACTFAVFQKGDFPSRYAFIAFGM